ncbi:MAG: DUF167 domain-containing protein [Cellvibrio sp.]|nr:DUF167 domain-containing protein [Cellvibrio sp.]
MNRVVIYTYKSFFQQFIHIKASAVDGKANAALIDFLSDEFAVAKNQIKIEQGELGRQKNIRVVTPKRIPDGIEITPI